MAAGDPVTAGLTPDALREIRATVDAEREAVIDPDHDWRVTLFGPLHGEVYQRQGEGEWLLVESNQGFA